MSSFSYSNGIHPTTMDEDSRVDYIASLKVPSTNSQSSKSNFYKAYTDCKIRRGDEIHEPAEIYSAIVGEVLDNFDSNTYDSNDYSAAQELCDLMGREYPNEDARITSFAFLDVISKSFSITKSEESGTDPNSFQKNHGPDEYLTTGSEKPPLILLFEGKYELISSGDLAIQISLDYANSVRVMYQQCDTLGVYPCLLLTLSGTVLTIEMGIVNSTVVIQQICDPVFLQWKLVDHFKHVSARLKSTRESISSIQRYYMEKEYEKDLAPWYPF